MTAPKCHRCARPTDAPICPRCAEHLGAELRAVPALVADTTIARTSLTRGQQAPAGIRRIMDPRPMPIRADASAGIDLALARLRTVTVFAAEALGAAGDDLDARDLVAETVALRTGRPADPTIIPDEPTTITEHAAVYLARRLADLRTHPAAGRIWDDLAAATAECRRQTDRRPDLAYKGPCPTLDEHGDRCGADLYAERAADVVECQRCRTAHRAEAIDDANLARARDVLVTVPEAVRLLGELGTPTPRATVYDWARKGRFDAHGYRNGYAVTDVAPHANAPAVYRLGDIVDYARSRAHLVSPGRRRPRK